MNPVVFLSWGSPWPAHSGGSLRTLGLLTEISKAFPVDLLVLARDELSHQQHEVLRPLARTITRMELKDTGFTDRAGILGLMLKRRLPYHCALLHWSLRDNPDQIRKRLETADTVYASYGHWGTLATERRHPRWILDQQNADVHFWLVYASQVLKPTLRLAAIANWWLAAQHFPQVYRHVGHIVSVCDEDKALTEQLVSTTPVHVIANGVDCSHFYPERGVRDGAPRILFTGTSAPRNITALRDFTQSVLPLIRKKIPHVELVVAGNFSPKSQEAFGSIPDIRFTGKVDDVRLYFNQSDVFVAPFKETHGSKLKIAESMGMGMPIVATAEGVRGFPLVHNESALIAHSAEEFASHVVELLADGPRRSRLGSNARAVAEKCLDWTVLGEQLRSIVHAVRNGF